MDAIIATLLDSEEPSIRWKVRTRPGAMPANASDLAALQEEIRTSPRVQALLSERGPDGQIPHHPYTKWIGAHWILSLLADLGYPAGDEGLFPLRDRVFDWLFGPAHRGGIKTMDGRVRRCASQEGNALWYLLKLGLADERTARLAEDLIAWQWPDGGWNCDKNPSADTSSFHETLLPLRGLALYTRVSGDPAAAAAVQRAAEVFLSRRLYRRRADGTVIHRSFVQLCYPPFWHYDVLCGLKVLAEAGFGADPRCADALDLVRSKRLPDGGWPAEKRYYQAKASGRRSQVDWGGTSKRRFNEWVTAEVLTVLPSVG